MPRVSIDGPFLTVDVWRLHILLKRWGALVQWRTRSGMWSNVFVHPPLG